MTAGADPAAVVRVDVVVLTLSEHDPDGGADMAREPLVLLVDRPQGPALPGDPLRPDEGLEAAAGRVMRTVGLQRPRHVEQLASFGRPDRMPGRRTVSVTYLALVPQPFAAADGRWTPAAPRGEGRSLAWDHEQIVETAVQRVRSKLSYSTIAYGLLPDEFTMSELQEVYEAVIGATLDKRNFRKKLLGLDLLADTGRLRRGSHRPAALYRFASPDLVLLDEVIVSGSGA